MPRRLLLAPTAPAEGAKLVESHSAQVYRSPQNLLVLAAPAQRSSIIPTAPAEGSKLVEPHSAQAHRSPQNLLVPTAPAQRSKLGLSRQVLAVEPDANIASKNVCSDMLRSSAATVTKPSDGARCVPESTQTPSKETGQNSADGHVSVGQPAESTVVLDVDIVDSVRPVVCLQTIVRKKRSLLSVGLSAGSLTSQSGSGGVAQGAPVVEASTPEACYTVTFTKVAHKKRPSFEDGVLLVRQGKGWLYNSEGKSCMIGKCLRIDEKLPHGRQLFGSGSTMIEIEAEISVDDFDSGRAFAGAAPQAISKPVLIKSVPFKPISACSGPENNKKIRLGLHGTNEAAVQPTDTPPTDAFMLAGDAHPSLYLEWNIARHLRPHQQEGVRFMFKHVHNGLGCILADSMGLGKTLQALCLVWASLSRPADRPMCRKVAIVCPSSLCSNWEAECHKWLGNMRVRPVVVQGGSAPSVVMDKIRGFRCAGKVIIISYEQLRAQVHLLDDVIDLLICDEGHRLKSSEATTTKALNSLHCKRRVLLTGTPLQNNLDEFWCCINFVQPMLLPPLLTFQRIYKKPIDRAQDKSASSKEAELGAARSRELARLAQGVILRRGPELLATLLPARSELLLTVPLTPLQVVTYKALCSARLNANSGNGRDAVCLSLLSFLRQLCNTDPQELRRHCEAVIQGSAEALELDCTDDVAKTSSAKRPVASESSVRLCQLLLSTLPATAINEVPTKNASAKLRLLEALLRWAQREAPEDGIVIMSGYRQALERCSELCSSLGLKIWTLTGDTPVHVRLDRVNAFNASSGCRVFLLSTRAGGVGLNIIGANRLIMLEPDWNPAVDMQAMGRVWRQGQTKPVFIYRFATHGTVEEKILQRQARKQELASATLAVSTGIAGACSEGSHDLANLKEVFVLNGYSATGSPVMCSDETVLPPLAHKMQDDAGISNTAVNAALYSAGLLGQTATAVEPDKVSDIKVSADAPMAAEVEDSEHVVSDALRLALGDC